MPFRNWLPVLLLTAACARGSLEPNGKAKVLQFELPWSPVAEGLMADIVIPATAHLAIGCGKFDLVCEQRTHEFDFSGTKLETETGVGLRVVESTLEPDGYHVVLACDQAPAGGAAEFRVRIVASGAVRFADAIDVPCMRPDRLVAGSDPHYLVGTRAEVPYRLYAVERGDRDLMLSGWGGDLRLSPAGPFAPVAPETTPEGKRSLALRLDAVRPGGGARLQFGHLETPIEADVLPDDSDWTLSASPIDCELSPPGGHSVRLDLSASASDQRPVVLPVDGCSFSFTDPTGETFTETPPPERACLTCIRVPSNGRLCSLLRGKSACAELR